MKTFEIPEIKVVSFVSEIIANDTEDVSGDFGD